MVKNFEELIAEAKKHGPKCVAVAACHDEAALSALLEAKKMGLAEGRLFGDREETQLIMEKLRTVPDDFLELQHVAEEREAADKAVMSVKKRESDILLKGKVHTSTLLRAVLDSEKGLRTGRLLGDIFMFEDNRREGNQLLIITDGGVNLAPDLAQKVQILMNAVDVAHKLGNKIPKVAIVSAIETIQPDLASTVDAALIAKMNERRQITGCLVDGPLALDNAISPEAAKMKHLNSPVAGHAEILICPNIEAANLLAKGTTYFAGFRLAHVIIGASAPVLIPSRADTSDAKLLSIALGVVVSEK